MLKQYSTCLSHLLPRYNVSQPQIYFDVWVSINDRFQQRFGEGARQDTDTLRGCRGVLTARTPQVGGPAGRPGSGTVVPMESHAVAAAAAAGAVALAGAAAGAGESVGRTHRRRLHCRLPWYGVGGQRGGPWVWGGTLRGGHPLYFFFFFPFLSPGLHLENFVSEDLGNTSLRVLQGEVLVELVEQHQNRSLQEGEGMQVRAWAGGGGADGTYRHWVGVPGAADSPPHVHPAAGRAVPQGAHSVTEAVLLHVPLRQHHGAGAGEELDTVAGATGAGSQRHR